MHGIEHVEEASARGVILESSHRLRPSLEALILPFYGVVVIPEAMFPTGYRYAVNHSDAGMVEVFVEGASVVAQLVCNYSWWKPFASIPQLLVEWSGSQPIAPCRR